MRENTVCFLGSIELLKELVCLCNDISLIDRSLNKSSLALKCYLLDSYNFILVTLDDVIGSTYFLGLATWLGWFALIGRV